MKVVTDQDLDLFKHPARIIIAGASNSGKTELADKITEEYKHKFGLVIVCGRSTHPLQSGSTPKIVVSEDIINPFEYTYGDSSILYILDDLFTSAGNSPVVSDVFTKGRHKKISVIFITQNLFYTSKYGRNISLNATHFFLMKTRDLGQIDILARQLVGKKQAPEVTEAYQRSLRHPYGYLLVDTVAPPVLQFRTRIFSEGEQNPIVYVI